MKREEANYIQDNDVKQVERIKVSELDIIVNMISEKPYYEIKYKEVGEDYYHIGYSSYNLDFVLEWKDKCFEVVSERKSVAGWIPISERLPEEPEENEIFDNKPLELYLVSIKGDPYPFRAFWNGKFFTNGWQKCEVTAWMPLPEPYRESEPHKQTNADRIRSMTDEELADFLVTVETYGYHDQSISGTYEMNEWLLMESEEEDGKV